MTRPYCALMPELSRICSCAGTRYRSTRRRWMSSSICTGSRARAPPCRSPKKSRAAASIRPAGGIDQLIEYGLAQVSAALPSTPAAGLEMDRFILTAHSGGGMPAVDAIDGTGQPPDELHVFDGLYGHDPASGDPMRGLETIDRWLGERVAREPGRKGALR